MHIEFLHCMFFMFIVHCIFKPFPYDDSFPFCYTYPSFNSFNNVCQFAYKVSWLMHICYKSITPKYVNRKKELFPISTTIILGDKLRAHTGNIIGNMTAKLVK